MNIFSVKRKMTQVVNNEIRLINFFNSNFKINNLKNFKFLEFFKHFNIKNSDFDQTISNKIDSTQLISFSILIFNSIKLISTFISLKLTMKQTDKNLINFNENF